MRTNKIYIEVPAAERLPEIGKTVAVILEGDLCSSAVTDDGKNWYVYALGRTIDIEFGTVTHWLEPVEVPTDEEVLNETYIKQDKHQTPFLRGVEWILQKLKINQK